MPIKSEFKRGFRVVLRTYTLSTHFVATLCRIRFVPALCPYALSLAKDEATGELMGGFSSSSSSPALAVAGASYPPKSLGVSGTRVFYPSALARFRSRKRGQVRALKTACARSALRGVAKRAVMYQH